MITLIAYVLAVIANLMGANTQAPAAVVIPPMPNYAPSIAECVCGDDWCDGQCSVVCDCDHESCAYCQREFEAFINSDEHQWSEFYWDAYYEYEDAFTALFDSYTYKVSKNGRSMVNGKFVKKG